MGEDSVKAEQLVADIQCYMADLLDIENFVPVLFGAVVVLAMLAMLAMLVVIELNCSM